MRDRVCGCGICRRCRRLESKLAIAQDVRADRRLFVTNAEGERIWQWQQHDVDELIAELEGVVDHLHTLGHGRLPVPRTRHSRSIGRFMRGAALDRFKQHRGAYVDPRDRAPDASPSDGGLQWF